MPPAEVPRYGGLLVFGFSRSTGTRAYATVASYILRARIGMTLVRAALTESGGSRIRRSP